MSGAAIKTDFPDVTRTHQERLKQVDLQVSVGDELRIFVDLGKIEVDTSSTEALDDVAVAALHMFIVGDPAGARARKVDVQLANFSRYDEYGAGVRDAAEVVRRHQLDRDGVIALLTRVAAR